MLGLLQSLSFLGYFISNLRSKRQYHYYLEQIDDAELDALDARDSAGAASQAVGEFPVLDRPARYLLPSEELRNRAKSGFKRSILNDYIDNVV